MLIGFGESLRYGLALRGKGRWDTASLRSGNRRDSWKSAETRSVDGLALRTSGQRPSRRAGDKLADDDLMTDAEGVTVRIDEQDYWIPWPERDAAASTVAPDMAASRRDRSSVSNEGS